MDYSLLNAVNLLQAPAAASQTNGGLPVSDSLCEASSKDASAARGRRAHELFITAESRVFGAVDTQYSEAPAPVYKGWEGDEVGSCPEDCLHESAPCGEV